MSLIKVTSADLESLSGQVASGASNISSELSTLSGQVQQVVGSDWMGAASSQFDTLYTEWQTSAANLNQALEGISRMLAQAGQTYQATEDQIRAGFAQ